MPPAVAAIVSIAAPIIGGLIGGTLGAAIATVVATIGIALFSRKKNQNNLNQGSELSTKIDPSMPRQILTGEQGTGGSCHFVYTTTNDNRKPNRFLYRVIQLSDQPCAELVGVFEGKNHVTFAGNVTTGWRASNQYRNKNGDPCMWMRVYLGSYTAVADSTLVSETSGVWTNNHKGTGLCYAIIKLDSDPDAFPNGEPDFIWVLQGAKVYDDRFDSTVPGGSGTQRLALPNTWEYTDTASVICAQFLRGFYINGVRIMGVGAEERDLSTAMLFSAHNTCEQEITINSGTEKRYAVGLLINASDSATSVLEDFQLAMDGSIYDRGGYITILPGATRSPVLALNDQDIDWTAEKSWQPRASLDSMVNCVTGNFIDASALYQEADLPVLKNPQWELDDGGERFSEFYSFRAVTSRTQGQRITKRVHEASRFSGTCSFIGGIWLIELEQGDWYTLTSNRWNFSNKYFEVHDITITKDLRVMLVGREVSPTSDIWDHSVDEVPRTDTQWVSPYYELPVPILNISTQAIQDVATGIQTFNMVVGLDTPANYGAFVHFVDVQVVPLADIANPKAAGSFTPDEGSITIRGLQPSVTYAVRGRTSDGIRGGPWTTWYEIDMNSGVKIVAGQITYEDGTPVEDLRPAAPGATPGAPGGTFVGGVLDPITGVVTGGRPADDVVTELDDNAIGILQGLADQEVARLRTRALSFPGPAGEYIYTLHVREVTERTTADSAFAQTFDLLGAKTPDGLAFVLNTSTVYVTEDASLAMTFDAITARFEGNEASIEEIQEVIVDADGAYARYLMRIETSTGNVASLEGGSGEHLSYWKFVADTFEIADPVSGNPVFFVDTSDGGKIKLTNVEVDTLKVNTAIVPARAALTTPVGGAGSLTWITVIDADIDLTTDGWVEATFTGNQGFGSGDQAWMFQMWIDGTLVTDAGGGRTQDSVPVSGALLCTAGTIHVYVEWRAHSSITLNNRSLFVKGFPATV